MSIWNRKRFSIYTSDEKDALGLMHEIGVAVNENVNALNNKTDIDGDHKGSWQGLNKPTLSDEGMKATVEKINDVELPNIKSSVNDVLKTANIINDNINKIQGNKIEDLIIRNYVQELTVTNSFEHYNLDRYGRAKVSVNGNIGCITGAVNKIEGDFNLILPRTELKQIKAILSSSVGYNSTWSKSNTLGIFINDDGSVGLDSDIYNIDSTCSRFININITCPIVKEYVHESDKSSVQHLINKVKSKIKSDTSVVVHTPDLHIRPNEDVETSNCDSYNVYAPKLINYVNKEINAFATVCNGDTMTEGVKSKTKNSLIFQATDIRRMFSENTIFTLGNHDDGSLLSDSEYLTKEEFNTHFNFGKSGIVNSDGIQPYFFSDDIIGKCRHIFLNTHDGEGRKIGLYNVGVTQMKWLVKTLANSQHSICIFGHMPLTNNTNDIVRNRDVLKKIFEMYNKRAKGNVVVDSTNIEIDFTNVNGVISCILSGHEHADYNVTENGVNYVTDTSFYNNKDLSVIICDYEYRKVYIMRKGNNRSDLSLIF